MRGVILIFIFMYSCLSLQAQKPEINRNNCEKWKYLNDVALEAGKFFTADNNEYFDGSTVSLSTGYFPNAVAGFRSGISCITGIYGSEIYLKAPLLFALRTGHVLHDWLDVYGRDVYSLDFLFANILYALIPTALEFNAGTSLGYITPDSEISKVSLTRRFASSLDLNLRINYQIWRFCLTGNMGVNYLWTKNYRYKPVFPHETAIPVWFVNISAGCSFRF